MAKAYHPKFPHHGPPEPDHILLDRYVHDPRRDLPFVLNPDLSVWDPLTRPSIMQDDEAQALEALDLLHQKQLDEDAEFEQLFAEKKSEVGGMRPVGKSLLEHALAPIKRTDDLGYGVSKELEKYQIDPSLMKEFVTQSKPEIDDFVKSKTRKPKFLFSSGEPQTTSDNLSRMVDSGQLQAFTLPEEKYDEMFDIKEGPRHLGEGGRNVNGKIYMRGTTPSNARGIGHEILHQFFGHQAGVEGTPKLNPYQKLDIALGGILPSFSKHGYRPSFFPKGKGMEEFENRKDYNERIREKGYHPIYADAPFKVGQDSMLEALADRTKAGVLSTPMSTVQTKGGDYDVFETRSIKARDFRSAFKEARKKKLPTFEWQGRLYSTELK